MDTPAPGVKPPKAKCPRCTVCSWYHLRVLAGQTAKFMTCHPGVANVATSGYYHPCNTTPGQLGQMPGPEPQGVAPLDQLLLKVLALGLGEGECHMGTEVFRHLLPPSPKHSQKGPCNLYPQGQASPCCYSQTSGGKRPFLPQGSSPATLKATQLQPSILTGVRSNRGQFGGGRRFPLGRP